MRFSEEKMANRMALRQLGGFHEEDDYDPYYRERSPRPQFDKNNHSVVVNEIARKIARAAFSSEESHHRVSVRLKETGSELWDGLKRLLESPGVREGQIVGSVMFFKMGLWFSYRRASQDGLQIVDL